MEHIELAGIHSGDSACSIPPVTLSRKHLDIIERHAAAIANDFRVKGILNVQFAVCDDEVWIIEANPRASRTVPIVAKVTGTPLAKIATYLMLGKKLSDLKPMLHSAPTTYYGVKEAVFPFNMFPEVDPVLGPEMRATGEVMGLASTFGMAYFKSQQAAGMRLPLSGKVLVSVNRRERGSLLPIVKTLSELGFELVATEGTYKFLQENNIAAKEVYKLNEGRPDISDLIRNREVALIINTPAGKLSKIDDSAIRMLAIQYKIPYMTTIAAAHATAEGIREAKNGDSPLKSLQEYLGK
jgi:carbamoyl-phosphate synthase large subunit